MLIRIFTTGGTIDGIKLHTSYYKKSFIPKMLKQGMAPSSIQTEELMIKDSREITKKDRELILKKCKECKEKNIIITHGTFTMAETAKFLGPRIKDKVIVLTGSQIPFIEKNSDALFNVGGGVIAVQTLPKGVYVTINGKVLTWNNANSKKIHV